LRSPSPPRRDDPEGRDGSLNTFAGPRFTGRTAVTRSVSDRMSRTGRRDTKPEVELRRLLHARGLRYRIEQRVLAGVRRRADIVFPSARIVVFVDGCFWHGCPEHATWPKHNAEFWREKIETNRRRDHDTDQRLAAAGWHTIHVWEHEDPRFAADRVEQLVRANAGGRLRSS
jgi:DNA mismatch endonuclease, patch repair protein